MVFKEQQRAQSSAGRDGERAGLICGADDLKSFLGQLSEQIADADRRHSETLRDMRDRLSRLGDRAGELKDTLPKSFEADIERLESGMARLTDQIETPRDQQQTQSGVANAKARSQSLGEPPALRSAMSPPHVAQSAPAAPPRDEEPWDRTSADALANLYDSGEAGPARTRSLQDYGVQAPKPAQTAQQIHLSSALPKAAEIEEPDLGPIRAPSYDNVHLDTRLDEIAARLDQSLSAIRGDRSLADLNSRFDQLEESWSSALSGVATRTDLDGLRHLEQHIAELSERIERTQTHLHRLDAIERQLTDLGTRLTDENIVHLFGNLVPTEQDLTRFAEQAADRTASLVSSGQSGGLAVAAPMLSPAFEASQIATEERLGTLQKMLSGFIDERRQGSAETSEALITLQEAMQVMLDRVDAIETKVVAIPVTPQAPIHVEQPRQSGAARVVYDADQQEGAPSNAAFEEAKAAARAAKAAASRQQPAAMDPHQRQDGPAQRGAASVRGEPIRSSQPTGAQMRGTIPQPPQSSAAARQQSAAAPAAEKAGGIRDRIAGASGGADKSGLKPGLLLVPCVALLLFAGYWFLTAPKNRSVAPTAARIEQPAAAAKKPSASTPASPNGPAIDTEVPVPKTAPVSTPGQTDLQAPRDATPVRDNQSELGRGNRPVQNIADAPQGDVVAPTAGITVQTGGQTLSPADIAASRQQMHLANMSQRTAFNAAEISAARPVAVPASVRQSDNASNETTNEAPAAEGNRQILELPPALVGPLSLRLAAAKGDASAQFEVAARFAEGKGVKQDFGQAAAWYQRSAAQGLAASQYRLAALFERGLGVKADPNRARVWYTRAAEQGNVKAMHNLAVLSAGRDQAAADYATAALWFSEAAERGLPDSQYNLGVLNESGLGLPKNPIAAYKWYSLAARGGDKESARRRDILRTKLDPATLADAEKAVTAWRPAPVESAANDAIKVGTAWQKRSTTATAAGSN